MLHSTVRCCVVSCRAVSAYRAVRCRAVPCHAMLCSTVPCRSVPCCTVLCRAVPCRAVLCRAVPCRAVQCCAVLCRAVNRAAYSAVFSSFQCYRWTSTFTNGCCPPCCVLHASTNSVTNVSTDGRVLCMWSTISLFFLCFLHFHTFFLPSSPFSTFLPLFFPFTHLPTNEIFSPLTSL